MKVRELIRALQDRRCESIRQTGSHGMYKLPNGVTVSIVVNHLNADVSLVVLSNVRRALKSAGVPL